MATVTFVVGLAGSGKSELLKQYGGHSQFDDGVWPGYANYGPFLAAVGSGKDCVVADITYCYPHNRDWIEAVVRRLDPGTTIEWVYFENDLPAANENCRSRKNKGDAEGHVAMNNRVSPEYTVPHGVIALKIWRPTRP